MKRILLFSFYVLALTSLSAQTAPIYLLFTRDCMDQLEYNYTYGTNMQLTYSVHPRVEEQFLLTAGQPALTSPSMPPGTLNCREFNINSAFVDAINTNARPVYMVHQNAQGFTLVPLASASQITRYGPVFQFRTPRYAFAVDTNNLVYEQNLALPGANAYMYFSGLKMHRCRNEYSFRRVPTQNNPERSDFDFIAGIGITSDRTGKSAAEAENNEMRLIKINGLALEDYITSLCPTSGGSTVSKWAGQAVYGPTSTALPPNQDKELASIKQNGGIPTVNTPTYTQPSNCPEPMGVGYHIMQPRETLNAVARTYGVDVKSLVRWNKIKDPDKVQICQKIWLQVPPQVSPKGVAPAPVQHSTKKKTAAAATVVNQSTYWNQQQAQPTVTETIPQPRYNYTPAQYNNNEYMAPAMTTTMQAQMLHTVQKGETLSGIARQYNMSLGRLRILNNMPTSGNVVIRPGQRLTVSDYTPQMQPQMQQPANVTSATVQSSVQNPASGAYLGTPATTTVTTTTITTPATPTPTQYNTTAPAQYNTPAATNPAPATTVNPAVEDRDRFYETPVTSTQPVPAATTTTQPQQPTSASAQSMLPTQNKTPNYQEYIVKEGETLSSIAIKYKADAQELAIVNNKEVNEVLIVGQRILVPVKSN